MLKRKRSDVIKFENDCILPKETWAIIASELDKNDLLSLQQTCKTIYRAIHDYSPDGYAVANRQGLQNGQLSVWGYLQYLKRKRAEQFAALELEPELYSFFTKNIGLNDPKAKKFTQLLYEIISIRAALDNRRLPMAAYSELVFAKIPRLMHEMLTKFVMPYFPSEDYLIKTEQWLESNRQMLEKSKLTPIYNRQSLIEFARKEDGLIKNPINKYFDALFLQNESTNNSLLDQLNPLVLHYLCYFYIYLSNFYPLWSLGKNYFKFIFDIYSKLNATNEHVCLDFILVAGLLWSLNDKNALHLSDENTPRLLGELMKKYKLYPLKCAQAIINLAKLGGSNLNVTHPKHIYWGIDFLIKNSAINPYMTVAINCNTFKSEWFHEFFEQSTINQAMFVYLSKIIKIDDFHRSTGPGFLLADLNQFGMFSRAYGTVKEILKDLEKNGTQSQFRVTVNKNYTWVIDFYDEYIAQQACQVADNNNAHFVIATL